MTLTIDTPQGPARLRGSNTTRVSHLGVGYFQRRSDDCLRAALATATQIPYEDVGEPIDEAWLWAFGIKRGLDIEIWHFGIPIHEPIWIGGTPELRPGVRHCVVCQYDQIVHDVFADGWTAVDPGLEPARFGLADFDHAFVLRPKGT